MLIFFSVKNYKTFKEKATLNMVASNYDNAINDSENITSENAYKLRLLKSAVIFGPNASGKSKLIDAMFFMKDTAINSSKESQEGNEFDVDPFRLNSESEKKPSEFEVVFLYNKEMYRYGFQVDRRQVVSEWLFLKPKTKEIEIFYRKLGDFEIHPRRFAKGNMLVKGEFVRGNALLLSVGAQFNDKICQSVIKWYKSFNQISGIDEENYHGYSVGKTEIPEHKEKTLELLKAADLGILNFSPVRVDINKLPKNITPHQKENILKSSREGQILFSDVATSHKKFDALNKQIGIVNFSLDEDESMGTRKFFSLTGPILDSLENGYTLVVDELDSKLHSSLVAKIISLFNSKKLNPKNAQLIFNSHDTNLLRPELFRKDQIWFTEKNKYGEAKLYSLADFKSLVVRSGEDFEKNYLNGKYGAVPFLEFFDELTYMP